MRVKLKKPIEGTPEHYGMTQHILSTEAIMQDRNTLKPSFEFNKWWTSGYLKYIWFIPKGTKVKITLEWETE